MVVARMEGDPRIESGAAPRPSRLGPLVASGQKGRSVGGSRAVQISVFSLRSLRSSGPFADLAQGRMPLCAPLAPHMSQSSSPGSPVSKQTRVPESVPE